MAIRTVAELVIGVLYGLGAVGQTMYVLWHSQKFYGDMADRAWFRPAELITRALFVPNSVFVTVLVIGFEATVAIAILTGGASVGPALVAGGVFSIIGALFGSPGETVGYGVLAAIHFMLASAR